MSRREDGHDFDDTQKRMNDSKFVVNDSKFVNDSEFVVNDGVDSCGSRCLLLQVILQ